ncbi:uncharacterized protein LOC144873702 [Branchiostoma floridae x Branchiostoma japonicum]
MASKKAGPTPAAEVPDEISVFDDVVAVVSPWLVSLVGDAQLLKEVQSIEGAAVEFKRIKSRHIVEIKGKWKQISAVHGVLAKHLKTRMCGTVPDTDKRVEQTSNSSEIEKGVLANGEENRNSSNNKGEDNKDSKSLSDGSPRREEAQPSVPVGTCNEEAMAGATAVDGLHKNEGPSHSLEAAKSAVRKNSTETGANTLRDPLTKDASKSNPGQCSRSLQHELNGQIKSEPMTVRPDTSSLIAKAGGDDVERIEIKDDHFASDVNTSLGAKGNGKILVEKAEEECVKIIKVEDIGGQGVTKVIQDVQQQNPNVLITLDDQDVVKIVGKEDNVESVVKALSFKLKVSMPKWLRPQKDTRESADLDSHRQHTSDGRQTILEVKTKLGTVIEVCCGDITKERVDVIVNAANSRLKHMGGVAQAIAKAGGPEIQNESNRLVRKGEVSVTKVVVTTAGRLPCKNVLHCVGPQRKKDVDCYKLLYVTCTNVLEEAHRLKFKSIAVPAISTGIYGVPREVCAAAIREAINDYERRHSKRAQLKEIRLIDCKYETVQILANAFSDLNVEGKSGEGSLETNVDTGVRFQFTNDDYDSQHVGGAAAAVPVTSDTDEQTDRCTICLDAIQDPESLHCGHTFCKNCLAQALRSKKQCPNCFAIIGEMDGDQPPGEMTCRVDRTTSLPGHSNCGSIIIYYNIPGGTQQECHPNPGRPFSGTRRRAFLPDNSEGRKVKDLLRKAFDRRLIFTIGTSHTTGKSDTVVWNDIHHKTNTHGGPDEYGYPDPTYLNRVREELAAKGVK